MNLLELATVKDVRQLAPDQIQITIDLSAYPILQNPALIHSCMEDLMRRYPNAQSWGATAQNGLLIILVSGTINPEVNQFK